MSRLAYQRADGTVVRALLLGLASALPNVTTAPPGSYFFATDTETLYLHNGIAWIVATDPAAAPSASTTVSGTVLIHRPKGGTHPEALTTDDLDVAGGVAPLDSGTLLNRAQVPIGDATHLGGIKQGANLAIAVDGTANVTSGGGGSFPVQHNASTVGTRGIVDFEDGGGLTFTCVDDTADSKVTITLNAATTTASYAATGASEHVVLDNFGSKVIHHIDLTAGTYIAYAALSVYLNAFVSPFTRICDLGMKVGGTTIATVLAQDLVPIAANAYTFTMVSLPFVLAASATLTVEGFTTDPAEGPRLANPGTYLVAVKILP